MGKRGQLTSFIIAGLILLLLVGFLVMFKYQTAVGRYVPHDIAPVAVFVKSCMDTIANDAVSLMKLQGGYIILPQMIADDPNAYVDFGFKIPFAYYRGADRLMSRAEMEAELLSYITANLHGCLNGFRNFAEVYDIQQQGDISGKVFISDDKVVAELSIPLKIKKRAEETVYDMPVLAAEVKTRLGEMHELAEAIMKKENTDFFLEGYVYDMIASSPELPHEGVEITCDRREWTIAELDEYIRQAIAHNFRYLTFRNTQYAKSNIPYFDRQYNVDLDVGFKDFRNVKVNTIYNPEWPINLNIHPSKSGIIRPLEYPVTKYFFNCFKIYHHKYSADFPVVFHLVADNNADEGFYFATPVLMSRDEPNRYGEVPLWPSEVDKVGSERYCANTTSFHTYSLDASGNIVVSPSLRDNRITTLNIHVFDISTMEALSDAAISYHCVKFRCEIGATAYPFSVEGYYTGGQPMLTARFPDCVNGYIVAEKKGYMPAYVSQSTTPEFDNFNVNVELKPLKEFDVVVKVKKERNNIVADRDVTEEEFAMVTIKNTDNGFERTVFYPDVGVENLSLIVQEGIAYDVDIMLVYSDQVWGAASYKWVPELGKIQGFNKIIFYVYKKDTLLPPSTPEEFAKLYDYNVEQSKNYLPVFGYSLG